MTKKENIEYAYRSDDYIIVTTVTKEIFTLILNTLKVANPEWTVDEMVECLEVNGFPVTYTHIEMEF